MSDPNIQEDNESVTDGESYFEFTLTNDSFNGELPKYFNMASLATLMNTNARILSVSSDGDVVPIETEDDPNRLSLGYDRLHSIPKTLVDRFGPTLTILDISHNKISNLDFLVHFKCLDSFIADNNPITENTIVPPVPTLRLLWFNRCKITKLYPWIKKLNQSCPKLRHLSLMGNVAAPSYLNGGTFYEYLQYRLYVLSLFDSLVHLDDRAVRSSQRREAKRLYRRPLLERLSVLSNKDFPFSVPLDHDSKYKWKLLHEKMVNVFEHLSSSNGNGPPRNFMI